MEIEQTKDLQNFSNEKEKIPKGPHSSLCIYKILPSHKKEFTTKIYKNVVEFEDNYVRTKNQTKRMSMVWSTHKNFRKRKFARENTGRTTPCTWGRQR